jgi:integrase
MPAKAKLTDAAVSRLQSPATGQIDYFDQQFPGLALRVSCGGRKTWTYSYRLRGKQRRLKLDTYPVMSVAQAHDAWRTARDLVRAGKDPAQVYTKAPTDFVSVFEEWMTRDQAKNRSANKVRSTLELHVLPHWRERDIKGIGKRDVLDVLDRITDAGKATMANRVHESLSRLFNWAIQRDIVAASPFVTMSKPAPNVQRDRVLSDPELVKVWNAAEKIGWPYGPAYQLLILTGARREEIGQLKWSEIDGDTIVLSGARTKNGQPHIIPLSSTARAIISKLPRIDGGEYLFTFHGSHPLSGWSHSKPELDDYAAVKEPWRIHDLRRTCATGLQKLGVSLQVTESVLGHTSGSRGVYQRHDYADEKRAALEAWGAHVTALVSGEVRGKVLPMRGKA